MMDQLGQRKAAAPAGLLQERLRLTTRMLRRTMSPPFDDEVGDEAQRSDGSPNEMLVGGHTDGLVAEATRAGLVRGPLTKFLPVLNRRQMPLQIL